MQLAGHAKPLNAKHPGFYWFADFHHSFLQHDYRSALSFARKSHSVGQWLPETSGVLAGLLQRNGEHSESQSIAKTLGSGGSAADARALALFHLLCGDVDKGADWAETAINEGDLVMRTVYIRFVACKQLRASHRWPKIAKILNLPGPGLS